ncbi:hypothetical protein C491_21656 [Natronococcus amylolyticus DSM 10524]|uniref:DUF3995 domain-containing protein n=1 Tax=Natronococcus amylolyticus DSM 10524 TaxID=1227497 RepID=L9WYY2_9EURY|nr:DUF3995 domain-containing protein [Natronococcus amylolyticus]ELY53538.1 hypothetical protein C491_21656 [Natronococcus amylolyticus DSM 10524]
MASHRSSTVRIAYAATGWWVAFAALSFYWAAGGTIGVSTLGAGIGALAAEREPWFVATVAATGVLKLVPAVLALSLVRPWGDRLPSRFRAVAVGGLGVLSVLYGAVGIAAKLLVLVGVVTPGGIDARGFWGHLLVWDPVWVLGGALLCAAAVRSRREPSEASH